MIRYVNPLFVVICIFIVSISTPVFAAEVSLGLGGSWQSSPYKGHDDTFSPIPLVNLEWGRFYINGLDAGIHLWEAENQAVSLGIAYGCGSFDSDKTDDLALKKLNNRYATLNTFLQYSIESDYGHAGIKVFRDILGNSDAFSAEAFYTYPFMFGSVHVVPGAGIQWDSKEQLSYYYGISSRESQRSGLAEYNPDHGVSPFLSFEAVWQFADNWSLMATGKVLFLSEEIKDSPMVDTGQIFNAAVGISYTF